MGLDRTEGTITYDQNADIYYGSLTIDFSSAGLEDIAVNAANNGLYVEVKSTPPQAIMF